MDGELVGMCVASPSLVGVDTGQRCSTCVCVCSLHRLAITDTDVVYWL